jgi:4-diphosphocytidyl-2-C-methyl-D-erythritol kinase
VTAITTAPAKINLWLRVGDRRPDGYHEIDTLFCALDLADTVEVEPRERGAGIRLTTSFGPPLGTPPDLGPIAENLAVRAAARFYERTGLPGNVAIDLVKRIPPGGGLGGGSSDAAAVLCALAGLHPDAATEGMLHDLAATLGSDVPFFVSGLSLAHGAGRGDRLSPLPALPPRAVVLVLPSLHVATADAYRWLDQVRARVAPRPQPPLDPPPRDTLDWDRVRARAQNDFETVVFTRYPELARCRDLLARAGASFARMTGSGSTLFGVFEDAEHASEVAQDLPRRAAGVRTVVTRTRSR